MTTTHEVSAQRREELLGLLEVRFEAHAQRHEGLAWSEVHARLETHLERFWSLERMEATGGEPDVVGRDEATGEVVFVDCSKQSPKGRRSVCYDRAALEARK